MSDLDILAQRQLQSEQQAALAKDNAPDPIDTSVTVDPIRKQALSIALDKYGQQAADEDVIAAARKFEDYLRGDGA